MRTEPQSRGAVAICAYALLLVWSLLAVYRPLIEYDSWWYHLPFSSRLWGIGGGAQTFHLTHFLEERFAGFPKAWEWLQGLAWWSTGSLRAIVVPQLLLCMAFFLYVGGTQRVPLVWVILAFFASPMLLIHYRATYMDLPAAICVALGLLLIVDLIADAREPSRPFPWLRALPAVALLGLAGNIKYQALLSALCVSGILFCACALMPGIAARRRAGLLAVVFTAAILSSASALANQLAHHNPFYPLALRAHEATIFAGPEDPEGDARYPIYSLSPANKPVRFPRQISLPGPVNFLLSATELDWTLRGVAPWYNIDSNTGDTARQSGPSRTGGWGGLFVVVGGCLLLLQVLRFRHEDDMRQRLLVAVCVAAIAITACLPRAHELRYWLFVPLLLIAVNLRYVQRHYPGSIIAGTLFVMMVHGVAQAVLSPNSALWTTHAPSMAASRANVPAEVASALRETGRYCSTEDDALPFRYSTAVTGVPGLVSGLASDCEAQP